MIISQRMVEVFRTDVAEPEEASMLADALLTHFPDCKPSFDLEDCDRVLRVEGGVLCTDTIINIINQFGYSCHILD